MLTKGERLRKTRLVPPLGWSGIDWSLVEVLRVEEMWMSVKALETARSPCRIAITE